MDDDRVRRHAGRRRSTIVAGAVLGLVAGLVPVLLASSPASAGTETTTNACLFNALATYSDTDLTLSGVGTPNPITVGSGDITLSGGILDVDFPADMIVVLYNSAFLFIDGPKVGPNDIPVTVYVARTASNATGVAPATGSSPAVQVDTFTVMASTTIVDPDGSPGSGDETATPLSVSQPLPDMVVAPTGAGPVTFAQATPGTLPLIPAGVAGTGPVQPNGSLFATIPFFFEPIFARVNYDCSPGNTVVDPPGGSSGTTYTPMSPVPFETVTVNLPPAAPVCTSESLTVGVEQTVTVDLRDNCTDVNGNLDPSTWSVSPLSPAPPSGGDLSATGTPGVYTYTAPDTDPGPVTFDFTVADLDGLVSNTATATITVLDNLCDATAAECSLTQIVVQPVVGTTMTFDKAPGAVVMSTVVLDGQPQVSTGAIQPVVVTNARGTAAAWDVTGYVTDLGIPGLTPTSSPLPGITVPACSAAGSLGLQPTPDRNCIPGDNLAWAPGAQVTHSRIAGDVAHVTAGPAHATDAATWLAQLVASGGSAPASGTPPPTVPGPNGLGGLQEQNNLCGAPVSQSGGTFTCNASLYLGVPASAGAGDYTGSLVLTLL